MATSGWFADPLGRHEKRNFNGILWTSDVLDGDHRGAVPGHAEATKARHPVLGVEGGAAHGVARVPGLDGVRGIAIVAVILYHNYVHTTKAWSGGFLGVDLFFVLSGFLITTLLLREFQASRGIDFRAFWSRRARRLLPALFVLLVGEALLARFAFDPVTASKVRSDGIGALFYFENWRIALGSSGALIHTWSLSVEEQWYLIWPLLLALVLVLSRRRPRVLLAFIGFLTVASAVECAAFYKKMPFDVASSRAFYGTDTRAQALLIGAGLAVVLHHRDRTSRSRLLQFGGWIALAFLAWSLVSVREGDAWMYRGGFLVVAVAAAVLIAAVTQSPAASLGRTFASRPLVAIGVVSYGLYLYHWPIFNWLTTDNTHLQGVVLLSLRVAVTAVIAIASYHLIEQPFRRAHLDGKRVVALAFGATIAFGAIVAAAPAVVRAPGDLADYALAVAAGKTPTNVRRVLAAGDSSAFRLALRTPGFFNGNSIAGAVYGGNDCDLLAGTRIASDGTPLANSPACRRTFPKIARATRAYSPAFAVLMVGASAAADRVVGTQRVRFGSPEYRALVVAALDRARKAMTATGARFVVLPIQCDEAAASSNEQIRWFNTVLDVYARAQSQTIYLRPADTAHCASFTWPELAAAVTATK